MMDLDKLSKEKGDVVEDGEVAILFVECLDKRFEAFPTNTTRKKIRRMYNITKCSAALR